MIIEYRGAIFNTYFQLISPEWLKECHTVVDVGAVYDSDNRRYDHHQRKFDGVLEGYNTRLSSAGLVYKHYGRDIIRGILTQCNCPSGIVSCSDTSASLLI